MLVHEKLERIARARHYTKLAKEELELAGYSVSIITECKGPLSNEEIDAALREQLAHEGVTVVE